MSNSNRTNHAFPLHLTLADAAGIGTVVIVLAVCHYLLPQLGDVQITPLLLWSVGGAYLASFLIATREELLSYKVRWAGLGFMLITAYTLHALIPLSFLVILLIIWIAVVAHFLSLGVTLLVLLIVLGLWFGMDALGDKSFPWIEMLLYGTFHLFAVMMVRVSQQEAEARQALEVKHRELQAAQHLLEEFSRQSERTRISRELHDVVGHHLTALSIKLQVAQRLTSGDAQQQVAECREVSQQLLHDVREAVSALRHSESIDFEKAVRLLVGEVPQLKVHLTLQNEVSIENMQSAQTLLRCIQEAITNTLRHSGARNLSITIRRDQELIHTDIVDDGRVAASWQKGNGLRGMEERLEQCGGDLKLAQKNNALLYRIAIPS